jgi:hypothetical protein
MYSVRGDRIKSEVVDGYEEVLSLGRKFAAWLNNLRRPDCVLDLVIFIRPDTWPRLNS